MYLPASRRSGVERNQSHYRVATNRVVLQRPSDGENKYIIYCPTYMRLQIDRIKNIQLDKLEAQVKIYVKFDIDVTDIPEQIVQKIIHKQAQLSFLQEEGSFQISKATRKDRQMEQRTILGYRFAKVAQARIISDIFWTPFEKLYLLISICAEHIQIWDKKEIAHYISLFQNVPDKLPKVFAIKFNFMDFEYGTWLEENNNLTDGMATVLYEKNNYFGNYDIAQAMVKSEYSNKRFSQRQEEKADEIEKNQSFSCYSLHEQDENEIKGYERENYWKKINRTTSVVDDKTKQERKISPFRYAHFEIPLYRIPVVSFVTIFVPIWILGSISLMIFFTQFVLNDRIGIIATIMMAYVAFMPTIREKLPPSPNLAFAEILLYLEILVTILAFIESFLSRDKDKKDFDWTRDPFFLISFSIQIFTTVSFLALIIIYNCYWKPRYNVSPGTNILLKMHEWKNTACDKYFNQCQGKKLNLNEFPKPQKAHFPQRGY